MSRRGAVVSGGNLLFSDVTVVDVLCLIQLLEV